MDKTKYNFFDCSGTRNWPRGDQFVGNRGLSKRHVVWKIVKCKIWKIVFYVFQFANLKPKMKEKNICLWTIKIPMGGFSVGFRWRLRRRRCWCRQWHRRHRRRGKNLLNPVRKFHLLGESRSQRHLLFSIRKRHISHYYCCCTLGLKNQLKVREGEISVALKTRVSESPVAKRLFCWRLNGHLKRTKTDEIEWVRSTTATAREKKCSLSLSFLEVVEDDNKVTRNYWHSLPSSLELTQNVELLCDRRFVPFKIFRFWSFRIRSKRHSAERIL